MKDMGAVMKAVRGHRMAKAAIENACWDLEAKKARMPLWKYLGGSHGSRKMGLNPVAPTAAGWFGLDRRRLKKAAVG